MKYLSGNLKAYISRIGQCRRCIRESGIFAVCSLFVFLLSIVIGGMTDYDLIYKIGTLFFLCCTLLFCAHLIVAGIRGGFQAISETGTPSKASNDAVAPLQVKLSRRRVFVRFARFAGMATAGALVAAASSTPANAAYCLYIGTECPSGTNCCGDKRYSPAIPYCCPSGTFCDGQGGCIDAY